MTPVPRCRAGSASRRTRAGCRTLRVEGGCDCGSDVFVLTDAAHVAAGRVPEEVGSWLRPRRRGLTEMAELVAFCAARCVGVLGDPHCVRLALVLGTEELLLLLPCALLFQALLLQALLLQALLSLLDRVLRRRRRVRGVGVSVDARGDRGCALVVERHRIVLIVHVVFAFERLSSHLIV